MLDKVTPTDVESMRNVAMSVAADMRCAMPGFIEKFDPDTNLAEVTPAIERKDIINGAVKYVRLPIIVQVPILLPAAQGKDLFITIPIQEGDECWLIFSDRFLDNFIERGEYGPPEAQGPDNLNTVPRIHHLADAVCIPCSISQPKNIPEWNTENIEIRNRDRTIYTSLGEEGIEATDGEATWEMKEGRLEIHAPNGYYVDSPNFKVYDTDNTGWVRGTFRAQNLLTDAGFNANNHRHLGVTTGSGTTGTFT